MKLASIAVAAALISTPLPASAHGWRGGPPPIISGIIGGVLGAIAAAHGYGPPPYAPPPYGYAPPPYGYPPPPSQSLPAPPQADQQPFRQQPDADLAFVQHALNQLTGAGLSEDGLPGPATKQALINYLQGQLALEHKQ